MKKALVISNLKKVYANGHVALKGIDLDVAEGDFFALLGPNGAGKTTTIGIITSLVNKTSGHVSVFGHDIQTDAYRAKTYMGVVPQEFNFNMFERVIDIIVNQAGFYGLSRAVAFKQAEKYLERLGLWDKRNQVARNLSGGMKRRLMIARALVHEPKMLILDEPTAGVDIELRRSMWDFLRDINQKGITIILTTHYLEEAESLCKGIAIMNHGLFVEKTTVKDLLTQLNTETIICDLKRPLAEPPNIPDCTTSSPDEMTLEISFPKTYTLNRLFEILSENQIETVSMRNKANRLEELFLHLVQKSH